MNTDFTNLNIHFKQMETVISFKLRTLYSGHRTLNLTSFSIRTLCMCLASTEPSLSSRRLAKNANQMMPIKLLIKWHLSRQDNGSQYNIRATNVNLTARQGSEMNGNLHCDYGYASVCNFEFIVYWIKCDFFCIEMAYGSVGNFEFIV